MFNCLWLCHLKQGIFFWSKNTNIYADKYWQLQKSHCLNSLEVPTVLRSKSVLWVICKCIELRFCMHRSQEHERNKSQHLVYRFWKVGVVSHKIVHVLSRGLVYTSIYYSTIKQGWVSIIVCILITVHVHVSDKIHRLIFPY